MIFRLIYCILSFLYNYFLGNNKNWVFNFLNSQGPLWIKMGQSLSHRKDLFPSHIIKQLNKLTCKVTPVAFNSLKVNIPEKIEVDKRKVLGTGCIRNSKIPVVTIVEGCAASAATMISVVGHERYITKHSHMLIHQLSSEFWGKMEEIKDEYGNLKKLMKIIKKIYLKHTNISSEKLDKILKRDIWWRSKKCLKLGLVDKILD